MSHNKDVKRTLKNERLEYPIKMMHAYPSVNVGWGAHTMIGNDARSLGMTNVLIVTTGLRGTGIIETIPKYSPALLPTRKTTKLWPVPRF
jgi:hypothetical protein